MNIKYCCPSYDRPTSCPVLDYLDRVKMYVSKQDYKRYLKAHPKKKSNLVVVPDGVQGNGKIKCLNWILDNEWEESVDAIVMIDDDVSCLMSHELNGRDKVIGEEEFYFLIEKYVLLAKEWGISLFGFNLNSDPMTYDCFKPFRLHAYLDGQLMVITKNDGIRYDEKALLKEDVDFMLQHIERYHKTLRIDKYYPKAKGFDNKGGLYDMRTEEREKEGFKYMQQKWGSQIIRPNRPRAKNKSKIRSFGGAIRVKLPLKGC